MLVDRVVHTLPHQVVERRAVMNVPDVHAGALAHGLQAFEHGDVALAVLGSSRRQRTRFLHCFCRHRQTSRISTRLLKLSSVDRPRHAGPKLARFPFEAAFPLALRNKKVLAKNALSYTPSAPLRQGFE